jgi:DNA-binding MarR family transcriptional regulator
MPQNYPDGQQAVNPRPSFFAVIPAPVRYCKTIPPAAKLLYGEITALCSVEGFCWASSSYFSELYGVDRATVKRWLSSLSKAGFIRIEVNRESNVQRRIFLVVPSQGVAQKCAAGGAEMRRRSRKNAPQSITKNITKSTTSLNVAPSVVETAQEREGEKVSPPATQRRFKEREVAAMVDLTGDEGSAARFRQLLGIADRAGLWSEWDRARNATRMALERATRPVEAPGAYFCSILVNGLNEHGVVVPVGTPDARAEVRALIAQSLGGGK